MPLPAGPLAAAAARLDEALFGGGICPAGGYVVTSDGSSELVRRDPGTFGAWDMLKARFDGTPVPRLNDLAFSGGLIRANGPARRCWPGSTWTAAKSPTWPAPAPHASGTPGHAITNGIAALSAPGEFLLTGKTYRYICHVRLVPARDRAGTRSTSRLTRG